MNVRTAVAIAFTLTFCASAQAEEFAIVSADEAVALNEQAPIEGITFDGGVGTGADLSGNGSMVQILQLQPAGGSIAGSAATSRFAAAAARR